MKPYGRFLAAAAVVIAASSARAGPPFFTDDPEPVERHHNEFYLFATYEKTADGVAGVGPAVEYNDGPAEDLQFHVVVPLAFARPEGGGGTAGIGDVEVGVKYRFVHESARAPQVGIFPMIELPTGDEDRGLGNGRVWARLPLWIQKSFGPWTTYGGGGWVWNDAPGMRSHPFGGWLLERDVGKALMLGGEIFAEGADADGGRTSTLANLGGQAHLTETMSLLFSAGHSIGGDARTVAYLGLYWEWGNGDSYHSPPMTSHSVIGEKGHSLFPDCRMRGHGW